MPLSQHFAAVIESLTSHSCLCNQPINKHLFNSHYVFSTILGAELSRDELNIISIFQALSLNMEVACDSETQCTKYWDTGDRHSRLRRADSTLLDGYGERLGKACQRRRRVARASQQDFTQWAGEKHIPGRGKDREDSTGSGACQGRGGGPGPKRAAKGTWYNHICVSAKPSYRSCGGTGEGE